MSSTTIDTADPTASPLDVPRGGPTISVVAWDDPVVERVGHDPRSAYVETFWLGVLGPSTTFLLRHLAAGLETSPEGYQLELREVAARLGLGDKGGKHSPFARSLARIVQFGLAKRSSTSLAVRRSIPPLPQRQLARLTPEMRAAHEAWMRRAAGRQTASSTEAELLRRARAVANGLSELGDGPAAISAQLVAWGFQPSVVEVAAADVAMRAPVRLG